MSKLIIFGVITLVIILLIFLIFLLPIPYTAIEGYVVQEPYTTTETYTDTEPYVTQEFYDEQVPVEEEECRTDVSLNPTEYINRGIDNIDALLGGDVKKLIETCKDVVKYRTQTN